MEKSDKFHFNESQAANRLLGMSDGIRIEATDTDVHETTAFKVVAMNADVVLGAGTESNLFKEGDTLLQGVSYLGKWEAIQRASGGALVVYEV